MADDFTMGGEEPLRALDAGDRIELRGVFSLSKGLRSESLHPERPYRIKAHRAACGEIRGKPRSDGND
jgi:hypothetical protein